MAGSTVDARTGASISIDEIAVMTRSATLALLVSLLLRAPRALAEPRPLTVEEAERLALARNPHLLSSRARAEAGRDQARSARGRLLPAIQLFDEYQHWNSPFSINASMFGLPGAS